LEVRGPGETTYLQLAYRSPQAAHDDFFAFSVLNSLLTGPSGLSFFGGGGISNKTSRLYRSLVEKDWAISVGGGLQATIDPFFYEIMITVRPDQKPGMILDVVDNEICRLQDSLVPTEEIDRAIKQARALFAYSTENITNQAFWLGYAEMFASYDWFVHYVDHLSKITPADIQRIAQEYLRPSRRVVGTYLPGKRKRIITHAAT
jgi:zinc protease